MAKSSLVGISLLAYASWQTIYFLSDRGSRVWARQRYHRYLPRPTTDTLKKKKSCSNCTFFSHHPDYHRSGICSHPDWKLAMSSTEVMVRRDGHCELWERGFSS